MPMQAKAEGVKLFHAKAQLWALLGFVLMLLWFANSGTMYFMVTPSDFSRMWRWEVGGPACSWCAALRA